MKAPYSNELKELLTDNKNKDRIIKEIHNLKRDSYLLIKKGSKYFKISNK